MSEVVRLRGNGPVYHPGKPDEDVVKRLRDLLEMAEAGELVGLSGSMVYYDKSSGWFALGELSRDMMGALFQAMCDIERKLAN